jgi:hypothetical protein
MGQVIRYEGVHTKNKLHFISFSNAQNEVIDIPIDADSSFRIVRYLERLVRNEKQVVEQEPEETLIELDENGS